MKRMFFLTVAIMASVVSIAQRNDLYSSAAKTTKPTTTVSEPVKSVPASTVPAVSTSVSSSERDVDEYNRRYSYGSSDQNRDSDYNNGAGVVHDTVYVQSGSYAEGYNDAAEEYEYALRMVRFHSVTLSILASPFYWDVYYNPWYPYGWRAGWVYYDPWYYGPYYPGWYPAPIYVGPVYVVPGVYVRRDRFVPDRRINAGWDRQLAGGARRERNYLAASAGSSVGTNTRTLPSGRNSISDDSRRSVVSGTPNGVNSRDNVAGSIKTAESRPVNVREKTDVTSHSNSAYADRDRRSSTPARNLNTTTATRQISPAVTSRSTNSGNTYSRPSSTNRSNTAERSATTRSSVTERTSSTRSSNVSSPSVSNNSISVGSGSRSVGGGSIGGGSIGGGSIGGGSMGGGSMGGGSRGGSGFGGRR